MNPRVLSHTLRSGRIGLIWYSVAAFCAVTIGGLGLSTIQGQSASAIQSILKELPPAVLDAFKINLSSFTSPVGYISARSLSLIWPLVVIAFAAGSAGAISGMIECGTIHFELSLPVSRLQWFSGRIVAGLVGLVLIVLVTFVALSVFASAQWWRFVPLSLAFGVLWLGIALQYMLSIIADVVNGAKWLGHLSIWGAYRPEQTVNVGVPWGTVTLWMLIGTACFALALWRWKTRDIPA
jgi:ABC-type transport system involved in multi-copper enzyme maturation permease subunit